MLCELAAGQREGWAQGRSCRRARKSQHHPARPRRRRRCRLHFFCSSSCAVTTAASLRLHWFTWTRRCRCGGCCWVSSSSASEGEARRQDAGSRCRRCRPRRVRRCCCSCSRCCLCCCIQVRRREVHAASSGTRYERLQHGDGSASGLEEEARDAPDWTDWRSWRTRRRCCPLSPPSTCNRSRALFGADAAT